jgi:hypothetical protein
MGTIIEREPTPIPEFISTYGVLVESVRLTSDESTRKDRVMTCGDGSRLNDNTDDENDDVHQNRVLSGEDLGQETRVQGTEPRTQFENGNEPTLLGGVVCERHWIIDVVSHVYAASLASIFLSGGVASRTHVA